MLFYLLVCLVAAVVLVPVTFLIEKRTSKVDVHMVLAGKLGKSNQSNTRLRLTRALVLTDSRGNNYDLRSTCLLYTSPSPRDGLLSRMPSSA